MNQFAFILVSLLIVAGPIARTAVFGFVPGSLSPSFVVHHNKNKAKTTTPSTLFLDKDIADMIDRELYRQQHKKEFETVWMKQNREALLHSYHRHSTPDIETDYTSHLLSSMMDSDDRQTLTREYQRDRRLAQSKPQEYCADRCVATGNCDVFEDIFDFTPDQVLQFCQECVLSETEEPCDLPPSFFAEDDKNNNESHHTLKP